jgi:cystathionine beta-lyase/cystathionine gamma-synthase
MRFTTRAIHEGQPNDPLTGAVSFPIYQTSTYQQSHPGKPTKYQDREMSYSRTENPTRTALENALAALEGSRFGLAFASGLSAVTCVLNCLKTGDHVIACGDLYGGSYRMFTKVYSKFGIEFTFTDTTKLENIEKNLRGNTRLLWLESPSNPLLNITDLAAAAGLARRRGALTVVDNTFATPYLQQPLQLGADIVLHSTTKYLNGHGDVINGALIFRDEELWKSLKFLQNACGLIPGPQDCYLVLRGIKTLALRMDRHCANARRLASFLSEHPKIERVYYPGLNSHPGHEIAKKQMRDFGAMLSFVLKADVDRAKKFAASLKYFTLAESLGAVKTLICHPPTMTHASVEPEVRRQVGIADGLIRVSVGIEDVEDLQEDLERALAAV